jgi:hypothetical protein
MTESKKIQFSEVNMEAATQQQHETEVMYELQMREEMDRQDKINAMQEVNADEMLRWATEWFERNKDVK